jgi:hypothetical protein
LAHNSLNVSTLYTTGPLDGKWAVLSFFTEE